MIGPALLSVVGALLATAGLASETPLVSYPLVAVGGSVASWNACELVYRLVRGRRARRG